MAIRVVIVGGSFAGLSCAHQLLQLSAPHHVEVTLIDSKNFFEYTPSIVRCLVDANHYTSLHFPLAAIHPRLTFLHSTVRSLQIHDSDPRPPAGILVLDDDSHIPFDFLVLATGSSYSSPIKTPLSHQLKTTPQHRLTEFHAFNHDVRAASSVAVIGSGLVGVELISELAISHPNCRLLLFSASSRILAGFSPSVSQRVLQWLESHQIIVIHQAVVRVEPIEGDQQVLHCADGSLYEVDLCFHCQGSPPNPHLAHLSPLLEPHLDEKKQLHVNPFLQVGQLSHIYAIGDMIRYPDSLRDRGKSAHLASLMGEYVARHIVAKSARTFEEVIKSQPNLVCLGLGPSEAMLIVNNYTVLGRNRLERRIAAWVKWCLEKVKMGQLRGYRAARVVYGIGDQVMRGLGWALSWL